MQSLLEVLKKSAAYLEKKGLEQPRLEAELLFAHSLGCKRLDLYLQFERCLEKDLLNLLRERVVRRGKREPLQYIIGSQGFHNIELKTDSRALIPRPETEELLEYILQKLKGGSLSILDLGTGSGAIALALAAHLSTAQVIAVDKSEKALSLAQENADHLGISNIVFIHSHWFEGVEGQFDLIVSNPPYLTQKEWESAQDEVKRYEPTDALVAENQGAADLLHLLEVSYSRLSANGFIALETGIDHHPLLEKEAKKWGYQRTESLQDLHERDRFFFAWK